MDEYKIVRLARDLVNYIEQRTSVDFFGGMFLTEQGGLTLAVPEDVNVEVYNSAPEAFKKMDAIKPVDLTSIPCLRYESPEPSLCIA